MDHEPTLESAPRRRGRLALGGATAAFLVAVLLAAADKLPGGDSRAALSVSDDPELTTTVPPTPNVTVPEVPEMIDPTSMADGWYLILTPPIFTDEDELLLQSARQVAIQARAVGYQQTRIMPRPPGRGECTEGGCSLGAPPLGYYIILKGPYAVPTWGDTVAEMDAEYHWHQTTQAAEVAEAASRGLALTPGIASLDF